MNNNEKNNSADQKKNVSNSYEKPAMKTESLTMIAAICNGTAVAGRKNSAGAPFHCMATKLNS